MISGNYLLFISFVITTASAQDWNITIPLNKTLSLEDKELYSGFINITHLSTVSINFDNINQNVSFIIFQVHSHLYNVTLYKNANKTGSTIIGSNIGLYSSVKSNLDTFYIYNSNETVDLKVLVSVHGYAHTDPIPGGCNMELPIRISPYLVVAYNDDYIKVDAAPPSLNDDSPIDCNLAFSRNVQLEFYRMYVSEQSYDSDEYFKSIRDMMTLNNIKKNGEVIQENRWHVRRMLSAYRGTGTAFVAVAINDFDSYSVYVPTFTYACSPLDPSSCKLFDDPLTHFLCASLLFIGCLICYFGHWFFKTEMFLVGMFSGTIITYVVISLIANLSSPVLLVASLLSGLFFGAIWLLFWWFYGLPIFAVSLATLDLGFMLASIFYYRAPDNLQLLEHDVNFWIVFFIIMILTALIFISTTYLSNILCCAVLGAYIAIYPIDVYLGSNLKYLIINIVRRAVVPSFNKASISPPFLWKDAFVTSLWILLSTTGFLFQHYHNRRRPPFPPLPRTATTMVPPERLVYGTFGSSDTTIASQDLNRTSDNERTPLFPQV